MFWYISACNQISNNSNRKVPVENLIVIKGGVFNDIRKALKQWISLYSRDLEEGLTFQLYKNGRGNHVIQADKRLDNERFYYLVNYMHFPEGIDYEVDVKGFTIGKEKNILWDKSLLVYVSAIDEDGDNVYITTSEGANFKVDFGGAITEVWDSKEFELPDKLTFRNPEVFMVDKTGHDKVEDATRKRNFKNRFNVGAILLLVLGLIGFLISYYDVKVYTQFTLLVGIGLAIWFFSDYELLQSNEYFIKSCFISVLFIGYVFTINTRFKQSLDLMNLGVLLPISLLIIQKPSRIIFMLLLNREPVVDKPIPSFWDGVYTFLLFFGMVILPSFLLELLK